jgi:hypothetical protein
MRSANILVALILLNGAAGFAAAMPVTDDLGYQPSIGGGEQIAEAQAAGEQIQSDRSSLDQFVGGIITGATTLTTMFAVVVAAPQMLINLGAPPLLVTFLAAPLYIYVGLDIVSVLMRRDIF